MKKYTLGGGSLSEKSTLGLRLHAERFSVEILEKTAVYLSTLKKKNKVIIDTNSVMLYKSKVIVYSNRDFWGSTVNECLGESSKYWSKFISILENDLNITLIKGRKNVIKSFGAHIARVNDEIAKEVENRKVKLQVKGEDGKIRVLVDNSMNLHELETVHKDYYSEDMQSIQKHLKGLLDPDTPTNKELGGYIFDLAGQMKGYNNKLEQLMGLHNESILMIKGLTLEVAKLKHKEL